MLQANPPIPRNILTVLDALAELGKAVQDQKSALPETFGEAGKAAEKQNPTKSEVQK